MSAQAVTILSGVVLLLVFAVVGWNLRRRKGPDDGRHPRKDRSS